MTDHSPISTCPDCGTPLPPDSPQALCPACLMRQALASRTIVEGDPQANTSPPFSPEEIADKFPGFEIIECLGRGGMGVVYKARQKSLNRIVAIKILAPERGGETRFAERFAREAEYLAKLNHPHIVTIHDFGETAGLFYLVMEFVDGVNLRDLLRDGKLEAKQALAIVPPICDALQYAHDKGIVHRDIKPENLLLDRDGRIKIADFGIAALMGTDGDPSGTPPYMAPEQCGASPEVDNRADIYALGVVLYEMLTGERPNKELIAPSKKVHIDVRLDEIVLRALEKTPELRYQTAGIFKTQVETIVSEMASAAVADAGEQPSERPKSELSQPYASNAKPTRLGKWAVGFFIGAIVGAPLLGGFIGAQEVIVLCGLALLLSLVFGVMSWRSKPGKFAALASGLGLLLLVGFTSFYLTPRPPRGPYEGGGMTSAYIPVKDNLMAAISARYGAEESRFELGKPIDLDLLFLNYSPIDMVINPQELPTAAWLTVTNSAGERVELKGSNQAPSVLKGPHILKSRDGTGGYAMSLLLFSKNDTKTAQNAKADAMAWVEPGAYTLQFHLRLPPTSYQPDGSSNDEYRTVPLTIEVKEKTAPRVPNRFDPDPPTRVEVIYSHPNSVTTASQQITVPVHPTTNGRFQPPNGQAMPLARGSNILVRACVIKDTNGLTGVVESSLDGKLWERQEAALTPNVSVDLRFDNGLLVELVPGYLVGSVNEAIEANKRSAPPVMLPAATSDALAFSPVMERELRVSEETLVQGLDFESGKVLTLSLEEFNRKADDGTERMPDRSFGDWVEAKGIDMYAAAGDKGFGLGGPVTEFKLSALPMAAWDTATETELKEALEHAVMEHDKFSNGLRIPTDAALPLTYALRSGDTLGLLQITARVQNPKGIKLRYKLVQRDVVDQVVPNIYGRELGDLKCFDFESNRFHTPPEALADELLSAVNRAQTKNPAAPWLGVRVSPALIGWLDQTGVDVVAASYDSGAQLLSLTSGRAGDEVEKIRIPEDALTLARIADLYWPRQPKSWFFGFFTREGNQGNLQITGITDDRFRDVKIRYKLVHSAPPVKPAPKKQYELSIQFGNSPNDPVVKTDVELGTQFGNFKNAGDRLFSITGQIDQPKNGKFPGSITLGDYNLSEAYKGTGHQGTIPVELELGKPFNHTVVVGIGFIRIITLNEKSASTAPSDDGPATSETDGGDGSWEDHFRQGEIRRAQDGLADALASYQRSLLAVQAVMEQRPQDAAWQAYGLRRIKKSHTRIGDVLCAQGDLAGALENYRAARASFEPLVRKESADEEQRNELTALYVKIGDVLEAQGDKAGALAAFRKAQEVDFPDFRTWEEEFVESIGGSYNPTKPFNPEALRQLAAKPLNEDDNRDLVQLICRAGAEKDTSFRYLLDKPELRKDEEVNLALIAYDYSVNGNPKALDDLLARLAKEKSRDSSVAATLAFVDEWDRVPKAMEAHFTGADGSGADLAFFCKAWTAYHFPRNSLKHKGKAGEGAPVPPGDKR